MRRRLALTFVAGGALLGAAVAAGLYLFSSGQHILQEDLVRLRLVLAVGWLAVVAMSGLVGWVLDSRIRALADARERERQFTSDVAHELRTPLTALVGEASLLRDSLNKLPMEVRRPAEMLVRDVGRLRRLVEDLMEISRLDAGSEQVLREPVDLGLAVASALRSRGWESQVEMGGDPVVIESDRRRIERIVVNLVGNAIEHGGGHATVRVGRDDGHVFIEVTDEGPGIPTEHLDHVFDRFYKADPSRAGTGSGLGLAIALENARLVGGGIDVRSDSGRGSAFTLRLPVSEPA